MQRVMQDRGVGVAVEGDVGAQAGLQAEIAEGGGASDEGIEEAVAITLQLDADGLQIDDRNFVAQPRCQQRFALRIRENGVFAAEGDVGKAVRSEESREGKECVSRVEIGGGRDMKKYK